MAMGKDDQSIPWFHQQIPRINSKTPAETFNGSYSFIFLLSFLCASTSRLSAHTHALMGSARVVLMLSPALAPGASVGSANSVNWQTLIYFSCPGVDAAFQ